MRIFVSYRVFECHDAAFYYTETVRKDDKKVVDANNSNFSDLIIKLTVSQEWVELNSCDTYAVIC